MHNNNEQPHHHQPSKQFYVNAILLWLEFLSHFHCTLHSLRHSFIITWIFKNYSNVLFLTFDYLGFINLLLDGKLSIWECNKKSNAMLELQKQIINRGFRVYIVWILRINERCNQMKIGCHQFRGNVVLCNGMRCDKRCQCRIALHSILSIQCGDLFFTFFFSV